jgi:hypothetical protein
MSSHVVASGEFMKPHLIAMLTRADETVDDCLEVFEGMKETPILHWGFKDVGLPASKMGQLVERMKAAGKTTYLEVVSLSQEEGLEGARLAVELGFDVLMGTVYFPSIGDYLRDKPVKYYPFPGDVQGHPSALEGSISGIVEHTTFLESCGADGLDLLTYRYAGDAPALLKAVVKATTLPVVSAGSIASYQRIAEVWDAGAWGFTIGTAFFEGAFVTSGGFKQNALAVWEWLQNTEEADLDGYLDQ